MNTSLSLDLIHSAIEQSFKAQKAFNDKLIAGVKDILRKVNGGDIEPTVDCDGRLHAPYDGYQSEDGHSFRKGQYIPMLTDYYAGSERVKVRIKGDEVAIIA